MKYFLILLLFITRISFAQTTPAPQLPPDAAHLPLELGPAYRTQDSIPTQQGLQLSTGLFDSIYQQAADPRRIKPKNLVFPAVLLGLGALSLDNGHLSRGNQVVQETIYDTYPGFQSKLDSYTRYAPLAAVYGLNLAGIRGRHNLVDLSMLYLMSSLLSHTATKNLKKFTRSQRPDQSTFDSFPSQHTASAFAKAELLRLEFRGRSPWYGVAGYSFAFATGGLRMLNNRHWFSDVVGGAAVGILSTRLAYLVYPWLQNHIAQGRLKNLAIAPFYQQGALGLGLSFRPGTGR
jgi:membrane-associated phospholipid phosphatase